MEKENWFTWVGIAGVVGTFLFGGISVWQLFQYFVDRRVRDANKKHVRAMKNSIQAVRTMCAEAIETQEVIKTEAVRQWVRQISWTLLGLEHHIDALMEIEQIKPEQNGSTKQRQRKLVNSWIAELNDLILRVVESPGIKVDGSTLPAPELKAEIDGSVESLKKKVSQEFPWFAGQFMSDANLIHGTSVPGMSSKHAQFHELVEKLQNRLARLGELLEKI